MAPTNKAAWIKAPRGYPMEVGPAEYPTVGEGETIVKVSAIAINPMDWHIQNMGEKLFSFLQYPYCGGDDLAGTVVEVGSDVTSVKPGDRVFGVALGFAAREGAYQEYAVLKTNVTAPIPDHITFEEASVLPLCIYTAASALYQKDRLALDYPSLEPKQKGETLLVWAGSSSVGSNAIQLAIASGYEVFTTSSPKNFDYCKKLGATKVFDYKSPTVTDDLVEAFSGVKCAGAIAIHRGSQIVCFDVVAKADGPSKFVACTMPGVTPDQVPAGVKTNFVNAPRVPDQEVRQYIWAKFLPAALEAKKYKCLPEPVVVGHGLEKLQEAVDRGKSGGISAQKLVVKL